MRKAMKSPCSSSSSAASFSPSDGSVKKREEATERDREILISLGTYDGGLLGYSLSSPSSSSSSSLTKNEIFKKKRKETKDSREDKAEQRLHQRERESGVSCSLPSSSSPQFKVVFALNPHVGCVKAIACSESLLLTGSTDECIRIFSLERRREVGILSSPSSGTITALSLLGESFLLSGDSRGFLKLWRCSDWSLLRCMDTRNVSHHPQSKTKKFGGGKIDFKRNNKRKSGDDEDGGEEKEDEGKSGILSVAVHPSCRLCFVLTEKKHLQLWNLMNGCCSAMQTLDADMNRRQIDCVRWQPGVDASLYALLSPREVSIVSILQGGKSSGDGEEGWDSIVLRIPSSSIPSRSFLDEGKGDEKEEENSPPCFPATWTSVCFASKSLLLLGDSRGAVWAVSLDQKIKEEEEAFSKAEEEKKKKKDKKIVSPKHYYLCYFKGGHSIRIKSIEVIHREFRTEDFEKEKKQNERSEKQEISASPSSTLTTSSSSSSSLISERVVFVSGDANGGLCLWEFALPLVHSEMGEKSEDKKRKEIKKEKKSLKESSQGTQQISIISPLARVASECRLTCMTLNSSPSREEKFPGSFSFPSKTFELSSSKASPSASTGASPLKRPLSDNENDSREEEEEEIEGKEEISESARMTKNNKKRRQKKTCSGLSLAARKLFSRGGTPSFSSEQEDQQQEKREDEEKVFESRKEKRKVKDFEKKDKKKREKGISTKRMGGCEEGVTTPRGVHTPHQEGITKKKKKNGEMSLGKKKQKKRDLHLHNGRTSSSL